MIRRSHRFTVRLDNNFVDIRSYLYQIIPIVITTSFIVIIFLLINNIYSVISNTLTTYRIWPPTAIYFSNFTNKRYSNVTCLTRVCEEYDVEKTSQDQQPHHVRKCSDVSVENFDNIGTDALVTRPVIDGDFSDLCWKCCGWSHHCHHCRQLLEFFSLVPNSVSAPPSPSCLRPSVNYK